MASEKEKDIMRYVIAFFFPWAATFTQVGFSSTFFLNLFLCFCGYVPGILHAFWVIKTVDGKEE